VSRFVEKQTISGQNNTDVVYSKTKVTHQVTDNENIQGLNNWDYITSHLITGHNVMISA
jgi:hypothetical protein